MADIFDPIQIGNKQVKNRIMMAATMSNFANFDGSVSDQLVAYLKNIAAGEIGIIVTGHAFIDSIASKGYKHMLGCHRDGLGLEKIAKAVKSHDCTCLVQLNHIGPKADPAFTDGGPRGPVDAISNFRKKPVEVKGLTVEEIKQLVIDYGKAAARCEEAGFDGVEIHSAHNYLLSSFISPVYNTRTDEYGGSLESRLRFTMEVLESVKKNVSDDFLLGVRWNGAELIPGGLPIEDGIKIGQMFEKFGVDYLNVSQTSTVRKASIPTTFDVGGDFMHIAAMVKEKVSLPVVGVGGIHRPELIKKALNENKMDIVASCRGIIAEPHLVKKIREKREDELKICIRCDLCLERTWAGQGLMCSVNSLMGREAKRNYQPVADDLKKKVLIAGGGVAGMEAARVAARKGHSVTLYEKEDKLGGQVLAAGAVKDMDTFDALVKSYEARLRALNITVKLGQALTPDEINKQKPDAVIVATGAKDTIPDVPGADLDTVSTGTDVLLGKASVNGKVAVVGGSMIGCQVALHLANEGCNVSLIGDEEEPDFASGLQMDNVQIALMDRLSTRSVDLYPSSQVTQITEKSVTISNKEGASTILDVDHVVFAEDFKPDTSVEDNKIDKGIKILKAGDCIKPKNVFSAIQQGANAGFELAKA